MPDDVPPERSADIVPFPLPALPWAGAVHEAGRAAERAALRWGTELVEPALLAMPGRRGFRRPPSSRPQRSSEEGSGRGRDDIAPVSVAPPLPRAPGRRTGDARDPAGG